MTDAHLGIGSNGGPGSTARPGTDPRPGSWQDDLFLASADPSAPLADAEARERIEKTGLDVSLFVEAAAGTGKTTALVTRIVALLRTGRAELRHIVALTYTDKAAGEMKLKLRQAIEGARADADDPTERARLERATRQLELAAIGTIHSFCGDLLREWPVEAGADPAFEILPQEPEALAIDRAFDGWFEETLSGPPEGVRRILRWRKQGRDDLSARQRLRSAAGKLIDHRDFPAAWTRPPWDREGDLDRAVDRIRELAAYAEWAARPDKAPAVGLRILAQWIEDLDQLELDAPRDHDWIEAEIRRLLHLRDYEKRHLWEYKGGGKDYGRGPDGPIAKAPVLALRDALKGELEALTEGAEADLAACLREDLRPVVERYERLKAEEGRLDFIDLLLRARDLIRDHDDVRAGLQSRFTHFFVDEFQDTDPLQAEILLLLTADDPAVTDSREATPVPGKLFVVGDPKQAIYRFRRADVQLYEGVKRRLAERGVEVLNLTTSFRGVPGIQAAVNAAFSRVMEERPDGSQASYVPLERYRAEPEGRPSVVVLPVPRPYGKPSWNRPAPITKWAIAESYPDAVGAFIEWLVEESGWTVTERGVADPVAIRPRHVCILLRRIRPTFGDPPRAYVEALEKRGIQHVLVGGKAFYEREEILALKALLTAIEWPDDALNVYAALKGPFFSLSDSQLLAYQAECGSLHPLRPRGTAAGPTDDPELAEVQEALDLLKELHDRRNERPVAETLNRLLAAVRAHAGIANWMNGQQALANCFRLVDRAREFEAGGAPSFRAFVDRLDDQAERGGGEEGPIVEEGTEGVRMMSVHRAKGLEFPVVILGDPTSAFVFRNPSRHVDAGGGRWAEPLCGCVPADLRAAFDLEKAREEAESVRLAYVAATRALDLLVVPATGDGRMDEDASGWLDPLMPAVYPVAEDRRAAPEGCPEFGEDTVFERSENPAYSPGQAVRPGLHTSEAGSEVVWWDPACLDLDREERLGVRQKRILQADESGEVAQEGFERHEAWREGRRDVREQGCAPTRVVRKVTAVAKAEAMAAGVAEGEAALAEEELPPVEVIEIERPDTPRPGGERFGSLVHATLAVISLDADEAAVRALVEAQARLLAAPPDEIEAAAERVTTALAHPILRQAAEAAKRGEARRETPVLYRCETGEWLEGVVDLAFRETTEEEAEEGAEASRAGWTVVDFKTDRQISTARPIYERQVARYAACVASATGTEARGVVLAL